MSISTFKTGFVILALALILAACSPAPALGGQASPASTPPSIQLQPCSLGNSRAQCGTLKVFENRAARSGRSFELRVAVIKAQGANPAPDPIFYLAGGPGDAATEDGTRQQFSYTLSLNHDVVFVDQRGTGGSNRVLVPNDMNTWLLGLLGKIIISFSMDPQYYTTSMAMDDLDDVRQALGYDKINLFGYSYGATAAQYYLRQHGEHVRAAMLGGGSLLDTPVFERWAFNGQHVVDKIFDLCQADAACQAAFPNLRAEYSGLMSRLAEQPVTLQLKSGPLDLTADFLAATIRNITKDAKNDTSIPLIIHRAYQANDWNGIIQFFNDGYGPEWWGSQVMERVIRCNEKWAAFDPGEVARLGEGSYLKGWDVSLAQQQAEVCKNTPPGFIPEGQDPQPGSQVPVLTINGGFDPIDPPDNMAGASALFPNSVSLELPYTGHSISDYDAVMCLWSLENEFIQSGSAAGLHTGCLKNIRAPRFLTQ